MAQEAAVQQLEQKLGKTVATDSISMFAENKMAGHLSTADKVIADGNAVKEKYKNKIESKTTEITSITKKVTKLTASPDSIANSIGAIPKKYLKQINDKADKYSSRITKKTEKTLERLCRWEEKIHKLIEKASPETAKQLFSNDQVSFASLLKTVKEKQSLVTAYKAKYNGYLDTLSTSLQYIQQQKEKLSNDLLQPVTNTGQKIKELTEKADTIEIVQELIKERKKQLMEAGMQYLGKSKYLSKINKETWYYVETMKNYKEIFSDAAKAEKTAREVLDKIPAFQQFINENGLLASMFGISGTGDDLQDIAGLQTRGDMQEQLNSTIAAGGSDAQQMISSNIQNARQQLNNLKDKVNKLGGDNSDVNTPGFKPNTQKTKTILQRLEYGTNIQFAKNNELVPSTADLGLNVGYKLSDKSVVGVGASYKLGLGSLDKISFTHQGIGLRSYIDWQLKRNFFLSGGFEMNQQAQLNNVEALHDYNEWQSAGLIGISKKLKINTKFFKATKLQLFYDIFSRQHVPVSQPVLFRVGYSFSK